MRPVNIKKINHRDELARRHRRSFIFKIVAIIAGVIIVLAGLIYLLFFSRLFDVREVSFNGLDTLGSEEFKSKVNGQLNQKMLGYLPRRNNLFFIDTRNLEKEFSSGYPVFKSVDVRKKLLHGLVLNFFERKPAGIWCFENNGSTGLTTSCAYFDEEKALWGDSAKSSGFIFLTIEDKRKKDSRQIDDEFFNPIMEVAKSMAGDIKNVIIPENSFNEFRVYTTDYYIIFSTESDIKDQLDVLKIFMNDKTKKPPSAEGFHPQYMDLRIDGRVYYK